IQVAIRVPIRPTSIGHRPNSITRSSRIDREYYQPETHDLMFPLASEAERVDPTDARFASAIQVGGGAAGCYSGRFGGFSRRSWSLVPNSLPNPSWSGGGRRPSSAHRNVGRGPNVRL